MNSSRSVLTAMASSVFAFSSIGAADTPAQGGRATVLEEVIVTAQKREESLQEAPLSILAFDSVLLETKGISGMNDMRAGDIPYIQVAGFAGSNSTLVAAMRGIAPSDNAQSTRESAVAIYVDDVYMGRGQGLGSDLIELERLEVLRGPQGTLFGRNAVGGAIRFVTKKPTGEFGFQQTFSVGDYGLKKSLSRLNLPDFNGLKVKGEFLVAEMDGWIKNPAPKYDDFNAYDRWGGRVTALWDMSDSFTALYSFEKSSNETTNTYYHMISKDFTNPVNSYLHTWGTEPARVKKARFGINVQPGDSDQYAHTLTLTWQANDNLTLKSITAYRDLKDDEWANFGGLFSAVPLPTGTLLGTLSVNHVKQDQFTQEFQLLGTYERVEFVFGLFYFDEDVVDSRLNAGFPHVVPPDDTPFEFSLDEVMILDPVPQFTGANVTEANAEARAAFFQGTWTPPILDDKLDITVGLRYSKDKKDGDRNKNPVGVGLQPTASFDYSDSTWDPAITLDYRWNDSLSTYFRWANAYIGGGANIRSASFSVYDPAEAESFEIGLKSEFWNNRARLNLSAYDVDYDKYQTDFSTVIPSITETINSESPFNVKGIEADLTIIPTAGLTLRYSHAYMNSDNDGFQYNPFQEKFQNFHNSYQSDNSGALSVTYDFEPARYGELSANLSYNYSDFYYTTAFPLDPDQADPPKKLAQNKYGNWNARVTLDQIPLFGDSTLKLSAWVNNITNDHYWNWIFYVVNGFVHVGMPGAPRMYGVDATLQF